MEYGTPTLSKGIASISPFQLNLAVLCILFLCTKKIYLEIPITRNEVQDSANDPGSQCAVSAEPKWVRSEVKIRRRINIASLKRISFVGCWTVAKCSLFVPVSCDITIACVTHVPLIADSADSASFAFALFFIHSQKVLQKPKVQLTPMRRRGQRELHRC